jgi:prolyl-tRNA editing enzyme YbaK/EbsC (Cys-tRNA(Pro) deacylase)
MHPTAARLAERLRQRGLQIEVRTRSDSARTAALAAAALDVEVGQIVKSLVFLRGGEPVVVLRGPRPPHPWCASQTSRL